ncbi:MAG: ATP-binding protein [Kiritimatiellae bacterium]|nr:ATP-binding protein [Kiritimatiellia bacterium]
MVNGENKWGETPKESHETSTERDKLLARVAQLEKERETLLEHISELEYSIVKANELAVSSDMANLFKTQFLANMSHDIRTPMNGVIGMAKLLCDTPLSEDQQEFTQSIIDSGETLLALINDILDLSKIEAGELVLDPAPFNLNQLLKQISTPLTIQAENKGIEFHLKYGSDVPFYYFADGRRIAQILTNLAGNAVKFTDKGCVNISLSCLGVNIKDALIRFEVADTGIGISQEALPRIFEKFRQADASTTRKYGGTGLGLAISRQLVELMGGTMRVKSEPGKGSRFSFELKLHLASRSDVPEENPEEIPIAETIRGHILLVDDSLTNQKVATRVIQKTGCTVDVANNGQEALDLAMSNHYDLIFMDCQMPVMDGYEAARQIRSSEQEGHIPIVAMTANVLPAERAKCLAAGMDEYITKPIDFAQVRRTISHFTEGVTHPAPATPTTRKKTQTNAPRLPILNTHQLLDVCDYDATFIQEVVQSVKDDIPHELEAFQGACREQDAKRAGAAAHKIKGAAANIGAIRLSQTAQCVQLEAESGSLDFSGPNAESLTRDVTELIQAISTIDWTMEVQKHPA